MERGDRPTHLATTVPPRDEKTVKRQTRPPGVSDARLLRPNAEGERHEVVAEAHRVVPVTTATEGWSEKQRLADPAAGLVYRYDTDATGRPAEPFRPDPDWWQEVSRDAIG
jgi:hypothetical protein